MRGTRSISFLLGVVITMFFLAGCENTESLRKGMHLKSTGNFKEAITHFESFIKAYPESERIPKVREEIAKCYLKWAENEKQIKHWEKGVKLLQKILDDYEETSVAEQVEDTLPEFLLEWAGQLTNEGNFVDGLKILKKLIQHFPASGPAKEGRKLRKKIGVIAFNSGTDLYVMNVDGTRLRKIAENAISPDISPDGKKITYIKIRKPSDTKGYLYLSNIDGRQAQKLLKNPVASYPKFTPDGTNILIRKGDAFQKVDLAGHSIEVHFGIRDFDTIGSFSPDGKQVVAFLKHPRRSVSRLCITSDFEEYIQLISTKKNNPILDAVWSPDNQRIIYLTKDGIHTITPDGEDPQDFLLSDDAEGGMDFKALDISPIGTNIMFVGKKSTDAGYNLYYVTMDKKVHLFEYQPTKEGVKPSPSDKDVSWGYGYLRY